MRRFARAGLHFDDHVQRTNIDVGCVEKRMYSAREERHTYFMMRREADVHSPDVYVRGAVSRSGYYLLSGHTLREIVDGSGIESGDLEAAVTVFGDRWTEILRLRCSGDPRRIDWSRFPSDRSYQIYVGTLEEARTPPPGDAVERAGLYLVGTDGHTYFDWPTTRCPIVSGAAVTGAAPGTRDPVQ